MNTATVTMQLDPSTAALLRALQLKAAAQGTSLNALLKPLAEAESESTQAPFEQIEGLLGVIDSRESVEPMAEDGDGGTARLRLIRDCQTASGIGDLAHEHDHYLYGTPKRLDR